MCFCGIPPAKSRFSPVLFFCSLNYRLVNDRFGRAVPRQRAHSPHLSLTCADVLCLRYLALPDLYVLQRVFLPLVDLAVSTEFRNSALRTEVRVDGTALQATLKYIYIIYSYTKYTLHYIYIYNDTNILYSSITPSFVVQSVPTDYRNKYEQYHQ